jgi:O-antigen chain-terminating methyltransferase
MIKFKLNFIIVFEKSSKHMREKNAPKISVDKILERLEQEIETKNGTTKKSSPNSGVTFTLQENQKVNRFYNFAKRVGKYLHRKGLYRVVAFVQNNLNIHKSYYVYKIDDFIQYHDEEFLENLYALLLNRDIDPDGKNRYLPLLRSGLLSKTEIITRVHFSKEGRAQNIIIKGAKKRYLLTILYSLPVVGYLTKMLFTLLKLPKLVQRLNQLENQSMSGQRVQDNRLNQQELQLNQQELQLNQQELQLNQQELLLNQQAFILSNKVEQQEFTYLEEQVSTKADIIQFKEYLQTVNYAKAYMKISTTNIQNLIDEAKKRLPVEIDVKELIKEEENQFDALYVEFEDKFRGTRADIKQRMEVYLPYLLKLPFEKNKIEVLDVGCGRGEWLELLKEKGYRAKGIDLNIIMTSLSKSFGVETKNIDVIEHLTSLEDESLSMITGFHIIEHLPFEVLMRMYKECHRVLQKGGMIIFETPNPENLLVSAHYFYTDPTHINPLVPATTQFLVEYCGFEETEIKRLHNYAQHNPISMENSFLEKHFNNEMDYSVIGYKR